jgi:MscS family membrane protein
MQFFTDEIRDFMQENWQWATQIAVVLLLTWLASIIAQKVLHRYGRPSESGALTWTRAAVNCARLPLRVFLWVGGIGVMLRILQANFEVAALDALLRFQPLAHILIVGWFLLRLTNNSDSLIAARYPSLSLGQIDTMQKVVTTILIILIILSVLPNLGISIDGLLAFGGIGGIIIGLAAKDMIANLFGAVMIYFDRPFAVGEWIYLPDKDLHGTVERIGLRQVVVRTFDRRPVYIPNAMFSNLIVINPDKMTHRRILETIGVRYQDVSKIPDILQAIREYAASNQELDQNSEIVIHLQKFNAYSVDILLSAFTRTTSWAEFLRIKEEVLLKVNGIIEEHGAEIAFPTQELHFQKTGAEPDLSVQKARSDQASFPAD